jgi:hypothetical protein
VEHLEGQLFHGFTFLLTALSINDNEMIPVLEDNIAHHSLRLVRPIGPERRAMISFVTGERSLSLDEAIGGSLSSTECHHPVFS